jgi:hypothetical protein
MKTVRTETNHFGTFEIVQIEMNEVKNHRPSNRKNFFLYTCANFKSVEVDFNPDYVSDSGSSYMYTEKGVYRKSNHWCLGVATCLWLLDGDVCQTEKIGFCKWEDFIAYSKEDRKKIRKEELKGIKIAEAIEDGIRVHLLKTYDIV